MAASMLEIRPEMTRSQKATVGTLLRTAEVIPRLPERELQILWGQLKDAAYLWQLGNECADDLNAPESRSFLRVLAAFWMAGIEASEDQLRIEVRDYLDSLAFLLKMYRELPDYLPAISHDYSFWKGCVRECVVDHIDRVPIVAPDVEAHINREFWVTSIADITWIITCARKQHFSRIDDVREYLNAKDLLPEDLGVTNAELEDWLHEELVELARSKFGLCRPLREYGYSEVLIYMNIAAGLLALSRGVTLAEAGVTRAEFIGLRNVLNAWLPEALKRPGDHNVTLVGVMGFRRYVMPLFDWVLGKEPKDAAH